MQVEEAVLAAARLLADPGAAAAAADPGVLFRA